MEKLKGLYISHKFENVDGKPQLIIFFKNGSKTDVDDLNVHFESWHKRDIELDAERLKLEEERLSGLPLNERLTWENRVRELGKQHAFVKSKAALYQQIIMDAGAGLPIDKYWEGKFPKEDGEGAKQKESGVAHSKGKKKKYGALTAEVVRLAGLHKSKQGESVPLGTRNQILKELKRKGFKVNPNTLRSILSKNGYSKYRDRQD